MPILYDFQSVVISVPTGTNRVQFLTGNANRVSLIVSGVQSTLIRIAGTAGSGTDGIFASVSQFNYFAMPFSDYGPLIQQPIFLSHTGAGSIELIATEIFRIPGGC